MLKLPPANDAASSSPIFPLPEDFRTFANRICDGFNLSLDAATLLMIQAVGFAAGNSVCIQTPEARVIGCSQSIALITSNNSSFPRGALMSLLAPVRSVVAEAAQSCNSRGLQGTKNIIEAAISERREIANSLAADRKELARARAKAQKADRNYDLFTASGSKDVTLVRAYCDNDFGPSREAQLQQSIDAKSERLSSIVATIEALQFQVAPHILADEPSWIDFPSLPERSFDGSVLGLIFAPSSLLRLSAVSRGKVALITDALRRTELGQPGVNIIACAEENAFAQALSVPVVRDLGLFSDVVFIEADGDQRLPDSSAIHTIATNEAWRKFCVEKFGGRLGRSREVLVLDNNGFDQFVQFSGWCDEFRASCTPRASAFFRSWPDLCLRIGLAHAIMANKAKGKTLDAACVGVAAKFLRELAQKEKSLLERLLIEETPEERLLKQIECLYRRIVRCGPMTKRSIARGFHDQDYRLIEPLLAEAERRERIERRGDYFYALPASVSASAT